MAGQEDGQGELSDESQTVTKWWWQETGNLSCNLVMVVVEGGKFVS